MSHFNLKIPAAIPIIEVPKNEYKVKKGNDVTMEVKFVSTPPPTDEWSVNGTVIKKSKKVCMIFIFVFLCFCMHIIGTKLPIIFLGRSIFK